MPTERGYLQSDGKANEVDDHFLVGQLDGQDGQGGEEQLKVFMDVIFLFTAQIDVTVQLLAVLEMEDTGITKQAGKNSKQRTEECKAAQRKRKRTSDRGINCESF